MNDSYSELAKKFKRSISSSFMLVDGEKLNEKLTGNEYVVTKKIDGIMQIIFFDNGEIDAYNSGGNPTIEIPSLKEMANALNDYGVKHAVLAAELYATIRETGRERVSDVSTALSDSNSHNQFKIVVFDILEWEDHDEPESYSEKLSLLNKIFSKCELVSEVPHKVVNSKSEVAEIFEDWVTNNGAEGLVVRTDLAFIYKIKPRHSIDVAVIGYTVGEGVENERVRALLFAVMCPDGSLQQIGSGSSGLTETQRSELYEVLKPMHSESTYITTDSRNVAYQMVKPEMIVEISAVDFATESASGEPKMNMLLEFTADGGYTAKGETPGVAMHGISVVNLRPDKSYNPTDIRLSQITDLCEFAECKSTDYSSLDSSNLIARRVFTKTTAGKTAVHKFLVWKTNKESTGRFPAYVLHHTDYCTGRKEPLQRDLRVSNSLEQIMQLTEDLIASTIKKGWKELTEE